MLKSKKNFLFDIDGTLAVDTILYEGTKELLEYIAKCGGQAFYITNNSTKSRMDYVEKFKKWGIDTQEWQFVTASYITGLYLKKHYSVAKIFVVGTSSFVKELRGFDLDVTEKYHENTTCVVVGFDTTLSYEKMEIASRVLLHKEVDYIATNPDYKCPTSYGFKPDCGSICAMLNHTVDRTPLYIGKPNKEIVTLCLEQIGGALEDTLVIGDRLYTDIACGINAGVETAVVLTGEATEAEIEISEYKPTYCFDTIQKLLEAFRKDREDI